MLLLGAVVVGGGVLWWSRRASAATPAGAIKGTSTITVPKVWGTVVNNTPVPNDTFAPTRARINADGSPTPLAVAEIMLFPQARTGANRF
jgi:hypothetical protein